MIGDDRQVNISPQASEKLAQEQIQEQIKEIQQELSKLNNGN